jgi:hypothetical protein
MRNNESESGAKRDFKMSAARSDDFSERVAFEATISLANVSPGTGTTI